MSRYLSLVVFAGLVTIGADAGAQTRPVPAAPATAPVATPPAASTPVASVPVRPANAPATSGPVMPPPSAPAAALPSQRTSPPTMPQGQPVVPVQPIATTRPDSVPMQNVRVDLVINDVGGTVAGTTTVPAKKVVTMLMADGRNGRIRSANQIANVTILINVDATATVRSDGRILLNLTVEYVPSSYQGAQTPASVSESLSVLVADGKSTLISQSADPATDRKVTVEVVASVVK